MTHEHRMLRLLQIYVMLVSGRSQISLTAATGDWFVELHADEVSMPRVFDERPHAVNVEDWTVVLGCEGTMDTALREAERVTSNVVEAYLNGTFQPVRPIENGHFILGEVLHQLRGSVGVPA